MTQRESKTIETIHRTSTGWPDYAVKSTPTILVGKTGTKPQLVTLTSPADATALTAAIDAALKS